MASQTPDTNANGMKDVPAALRLFVDMITLERTPLTMVLWGIFVAGVVVHILWACGLLTSLGFDAGFFRATAGERIESLVNRSLELELTREIRDQMEVLCGETRLDARNSISLYIEQLQDEYEGLTSPTPGIQGRRVAEAPCPVPTAQVSAPPGSSTIITTTPAPKP